MSNQEEPSKIRIDRWLWVTRLYKTRSLATEACKKGVVKVDKQPVKPSKEVKVGDQISIKMGPLIKEVRVEALAQRRLSAPLASKLLRDLTPPEVYEKAKAEKLLIPLKAKGLKGTGRPTKKQRRALDEFLYPEG